MATSKWTWSFAGCLFVLVVAAVTRLHELELRPLHSDEGVNHFFVEEVRREGFYRYSHENYHGPLYFYLATATTHFFGDDSFGLRMSGVVPGLAVVVLAFFFIWSTAHSSAVSTATLAGCLVALSPSMVFYARYAIHETLFLVLSLWFAYATFRWITDRAPKWLFHLAVGGALLVATKETVVITFFAIAVGGILAIGRDVRSVCTSLWAQRSVVIESLLAAGVLIVAIYTAGFTWWEGMGELVAALPQWVGRSNPSGEHSKPVAYYLSEVILPTEPYLLLLPLLVPLAMLAERDRGRDLRVGLFLCGWCLASFAVYSCVSYKTPWLIGNSTLPALLLLAWSLASLLSYTLPSRVVTLAIVGVTVFLAIDRALKLNYRTVPILGSPLAAAAPFGETNPFSYVHTTQELVAAADQIVAFVKDHPKSNVLVALSSYWPLPFYLRPIRDRLQYLSATNIEPYLDNFQVFVVDADVELPEQQWQQLPFVVMDGRHGKVFFRRSPVVGPRDDRPIS
ncbi:MAG: TIGR03663 family protein [Bdellovibrionales bacterium]|nr:TIGR03663 family protein [Bdellovibrionales bacterium]